MVLLYDKSLEWEKLMGYLVEVRVCCIGNRESGYFLIVMVFDDIIV